MQDESEWRSGQCQFGTANGPPMQGATRPKTHERRPKLALSQSWTKGISVTTEAAASGPQLRGTNYVGFLIRVTKRRSSPRNVTRVG